MLQCGLRQVWAMSSMYILTGMIFCPRPTNTIPVYGCFLSTLQTTVRSFYNIDGSDASDCYGGCWFPGYTLVNSEMEIIFRERQHMRAMGIDEQRNAVPGQYSSPMPMAYNGSQTSTSRAPRPQDVTSDVTASSDQPATTSPDQPAVPSLGQPAATLGSGEKAKAKPKRGKGARPKKIREKKSGTRRGVDPVRADLSTIAETSHEAIGTGPTPHAARITDEEQPSDADAQQSQPEAKQAQSGTARSFPLLKYFDKVWDLVPTNKRDDKENKKPDGSNGQDELGAREEAEASEVTDTSPLQHVLPDDHMVPSHVPHASHGLDDDVRPVADGSKSADHALEDDFATMRPISTTENSHTLESHSTSAQGNSVLNHDLSHDHISPARTGNRSHTLEDDYQSSIARKSLKHHLDTHEPIRAALKSTSHRLHEDDEEVSPTSAVRHNGGGKDRGNRKRSLVTHELGDVANGRGVSGPKPTNTHGLHDDTTQVRDSEEISEAGPSGLAHDLDTDAVASAKATAKAHNLNEDDVGGLGAYGQRRDPESTGVAHDLNDDAIAKNLEETPGAWPSGHKRAPHGLEEELL